MSQTLRRVPTGINGFDDIALGGLPAGRATLVTGTPGSGKSLFAIEFLVHGIVQFGEPGVFVTFEESPDDIRGNAAALGFDIARLEQDRKWLFVDASLITVEHGPTVGTYDFGPLIARIELAIRRAGARRVALDPLGGVLSRFADRDTVRMEMGRLVLALQALGVVAVLTAEKDDEYATTSRQGIEEFVPANVIILRNVLMMEKRRRTVEILKFRGAAHRTGEWLFAIDGRDGIVVLPLAFVATRERASERRISSGNAELDRMCGGGFFRDALVLIVGPPGAGKTLCTLQFAVAAARSGERCLLCTFDETRDQLDRNSRSWGMDLGRMEESGEVHVLADYPETTSLEDHFLRLRDAIDHFDPHRLVIDSLSALERIAGARSLLDFITALGGLVRRREITTLVTAAPAIHQAAGGSSAAVEAISLTDVTIRLHYLEDAGRHRRAVSVIQTRGSAHDETVHRITIDDTGMHISGPLVQDRREHDLPAVPVGQEVEPDE